jgi:hypothetical protein
VWFEAGRTQEFAQILDGRNHPVLNRCFFDPPQAASLEAMRVPLKID